MCMCCILQMLFSGLCYYLQDVNVSFTVSVFSPGCGVNLGIRGLESLGSFIYRTATAVDQNDILKALSEKMQHSRQLEETFRQTGLAETMYQ